MKALAPVLVPVQAATTAPLRPLFGGKKSKKTGGESIVPEGWIGGVFYVRVSTDKQEIAGNGLEAQKETILNFAEQNKIFQIGEFHVETGSGGAKIEKRPVLQNAIDIAKTHDAYVVTSKLDRLSRNSAMVCNMLEDGFKFVTVEHGFQSDALLIRIIAAVAQKERELIGERTKAALAQRKKRYEEEYQRQLDAGVENPVKKKLGIPDVSKAPKHISHKRKAEGLDRAYKYANFMINPVMEELRRENPKGRKPNRKMIADRMNEKGYKTEYGSPWTESIIYHTMKKISAATSVSRSGSACDGDSDDGEAADDSFYKLSADELRAKIREEIEKEMREKIRKEEEERIRAELGLGRLSEPRPNEGQPNEPSPKEDPPLCPTVQVGVPLEEESKDDSEEESKDDSEEESKDDSEEESKDDPEEESKDDPEEESKDDPEEESKDDPEEESKDDPEENEVASSDEEDYEEFTFE